VLISPLLFGVMCADLRIMWARAQPVAQPYAIDAQCRGYTSAELRREPYLARELLSDVSMVKDG